MSKRKKAALEQAAVSTTNKMPCCPQVSNKEACNALDFRYRISRDVQLDGNKNVTVEMIIKARLEVCRGPLTLGKLAYSTSLLPGEKVRLATRDRRNSFSFDSETNLSYRQEQSYEEQFYLSTMSEFMSDLTINQKDSNRSSSSHSVSSKASSKGILGSILGGPGVNARGNYSGESTSDFMRELSSHAQSSHQRSEQATHTINSVTMGEVNTRTHVEGESEDHYEASSRVFSNPNRCHAVTYYFYQLNQEQTVRFSIESIQRKVVDQAAQTRFEKRPDKLTGEVSVIPSAVLATSGKRLAVEDADRRSIINRANTNDLSYIGESVPTRNFALSTTFANPASFQAPLTKNERQQALAMVDDDLAGAGILNKRTKQLSDEMRKELSFEIKTQLPTNGMHLKTCVDECPACEPAVMEEVKLELEHKMLKNLLLKKQIELLEKSKDYRCCDNDKADSPAESSE